MQYWHWVDGEGGGSDRHWATAAEAEEDAKASLQDYESDEIVYRFVELWDTEDSSTIEEYQIYP